MSEQFRRAFSTEMGQAVTMPYRNVVRMHFMIFIIAGLGLAGVPDLALYPTLLLYFFPLDSARELWKSRSVLDLQ